MGRFGLGLALLALCAGATGQGRVRHVIRLQQALAVLEAERTESEEIADYDKWQTEVFKRLSDLLRRNGRKGIFGGTLHHVPEPKVLLVGGTAEEAELVTKIIGALEKPELPRFAVQCTLLTMPQDLAAKLKLEPDEPFPVDEVAAGRILKQAIEQGGTLKNLPEGRGLTLRPFDVAARGPDGAVAEGTPGLHITAVPCGDDAALFDVELFGTGFTKGIPRARLHRTVRLQPGAGLMLRAHPVDRGKDAPATVLWLRFTRLEPAPERK